MCKLDTRAYLKEIQYKNSSKLEKRVALHVKYGRNDWFEWLAEQTDFAEDAEILDIGCGAEWFWARARAALPNKLDITLADMSEGMVTEALERVRSLWGNIQGVTADVCHLPFADDILRCTDARDSVAFLTSFPSGDGATG